MPGCSQLQGPGFSLGAWEMSPRVLPGNQQALNKWFSLSEGKQCGRWLLHTSQATISPPVSSAKHRDFSEPPLAIAPRPSGLRSCRLLVFFATDCDCGTHPAATWTDVTSSLDHPYFCPSLHTLPLGFFPHLLQSLP